MQGKKGLRILATKGEEMRKIIQPFVENCRIKKGLMASDSSFGNNGIFIIPYQSLELTVIISDGLGWDHVSVSIANHTPTWDQMVYIKNLFWEEEETVFQLHPPKSIYKNFHPHCLHLWKPQHKEISLPLPEMVAP